MYVYVYSVCLCVSQGKSVLYAMFPLSCAHTLLRSGCRIPAHEAQFHTHFYCFSV
jgi:hypothetical protein